MTIAFRSIFLVNSEKKNDSFRSVNYFCYVCFTGKSENLAETPIFEDFFHFCSKWSPFSKMLVLIEILSFLKEISSVFESDNFWWRCILLVKNNILCKNVSFWAYEWISKNSDKIMSCKLWGKITSVSVNINFGAKMLILCKKKIMKFWEKCWLFH